MNKEKIINVPNLLTLLRVTLILVIIFMFFKSYSMGIILIFFILAAITDFLDGKIARTFKQETKFGAKFDIIADRFLWITFGVLVFIYFMNVGKKEYLLELTLIFSREIICTPFFFFSFFSGKKFIVKAKISGKVTTFLQGFAIPILILRSFSFSFFNFSFYFSIATFISGIWAAKDYLEDIGF